MAPIHLAIVGVGKIVRDQHLPAVAKNGDYKLIAAASRHGVVDGIDKFAPAKDAFDTTELIGKPLADAETQAAEHGCKVVVSMEDDRGLPVSTAIDPTQILVHTEDGAVVEIEGVGGGL